jgi:predicted DNA-binding transcriptional regulator YafY
VKSDRLLSALMLLQAYGRLSTRELAERLEISQRTAHRDMEALCVSGIPLVALRGAQGGWQLEKGWRTKVPGLDEAELRALLMVQPGALGDPRLIAAAERAFGKLMAAMPGPMRIQATSIRARLHIDSTGWRPSNEGISMLPIVQDAISRDAKLTFLYKRADGDTAPRTVDPLGLVFKQTVWYLVARAAAGMRTYRISRMSNAVILSTLFERPSKFNLAAYWKSSTAKIGQQPTGYSATFALSPEAAVSISRWCQVAPYVGSSLKVSAIPTDWVTLKIEFEMKSQARFVALGLGSQILVLAPADLRDEIGEEIDKLTTRSRPRDRISKRNNLQKLR